MSVKRARKSRNITNPEDINSGYYAYADGTYASSTFWVNSGFFEVLGNVYYSFSFDTIYHATRWYGIVWFDENKNYISTDNVQNPGNMSFTTKSPQEARCAVIDINADTSTNVLNPTDVLYLMVNEGSTALPYEPYGATIWEPCAVKRYHNDAWINAEEYVRHNGAWDEQ